MAAKCPTAQDLGHTVNRLDLRDDQLARANAMAGIVNLLESIGEDPGREGVLETPARVVKAYREMTEGYSQDPAEILSKRFDVNSDDLVIVRGVRFTSLCEHHLLPFTGVAHVAYLPSTFVVGLSKLARLVDCFSKRLQVQERMTEQIAQALMDHTEAQGSACVVVGHHACMGCRGVRQPDADMVTSAMYGRCRTDNALRTELLTLLNLGGAP